MCIVTAYGTIKAIKIPAHVDSGHHEKVGAFDRRNRLKFMMGHSQV